MFVSTRLATGIQILTRPVPLLRGLGGNRQLLLVLPLPFRRALEQAQTFLETELRREPPPRRYDVDHVAGRYELDLVSRFDAVLFGNALGKRDLELAGDSRHRLTLARTKSLSTAESLSGCL